MTTQSENSKANELLSKVAQQQAQGSKTLGLHITQHESFESVTQERIERAIQQALSAIEQTHQTALANASTDLQRRFAAETDSGLARLQDHHERAAESQRRILAQELEAATQNALAAYRREFEESRARIIAEVNESVTQALEAAAAENQDTLDAVVANLNAEHQRNTDAAIAAVNATWTKLARILIGATAASIVVAAAAIVIALL